MSNEHPKEQVLVIPATIALVLAPAPFNTVPPNLERDILASHSFRDRTEAETNYDFKQVIPYIVVRNGHRFLLAQRTSKQQETRLHNMYSIGQGGHINELDFGTERSPLIAGMMREISEEFTLGNVTEVKAAGLINDDSSDVGRVHLGVVYMMWVDSTDFKIGEEGKHTAQWAGAAKLHQHYAAMENWSKIIMDRILFPA